MLLLVADTSGQQGGVGLVRAAESTEHQIEQVDEVSLVGGTFSAQLVPQISGLLAKHNLVKSQIEAFVVVSGPGSFTGLRVGLAAIKALAEILQKPIVPVSLLEVIAVAAGVDEKVLAAIDAGRGEVYVGEYVFVNGGGRRENEQLLRMDDFLAIARQSRIVTNSDLVAQSARQSGLSVSLVVRIDSAMIGRVGWMKLQAGETVSPERLDANYIRRSDAEIFAKPTPRS